MDKDEAKRMPTFLKPKALRRTFASRLVMNRVDLSTVKKLRGRKGITMTLRYSRLSDSRKQRVVEILSAPIFASHS